MQDFSNGVLYTSLNAMHEATGSYVDDSWMDMAMHYGE